MLGQLKPAAAQHVRLIHKRVHEQHRRAFERLRVLPAEKAAGRHVLRELARERRVVLDVLVYEVGHVHIGQGVFGEVLFHGIQHGAERRFVHPVVRVHDLVVQPGRVAYALVDALAVAAVLLVNGVAYSRISRLVLVGDLPRSVLRAVVNNDDLDVLAAFEYAVYAVAHIRLRVVARYGECNQFHFMPEFSFHLSL